MDACASVWSFTIHFEEVGWTALLCIQGVLDLQISSITSSILVSFGQARLVVRPSSVLDMSVVMKATVGIYLLSVFRYCQERPPTHRIIVFIICFLPSCHAFPSLGLPVW